LGNNSADIGNDNEGRGNDSADERQGKSSKEIGDILAWQQGGKGKGNKSSELRGRIVKIGRRAVNKGEDYWDHQGHWGYQGDGAVVNKIVKLVEK